jgi:hypothetical protein
LDGRTKIAECKLRTPQYIFARASSCRTGMKPSAFFKRARRFEILVDMHFIASARLMMAYAHLNTVDYLRVVFGDDETLRRVKYSLL